MPFLQIGYKRIYYTDTHPKDGTKPKETFIFTHGLGSTSSYYFPIIPALSSAPNSFRCITYDTTGQGQSPYTQIEQSISTLAEDVIGVLDALKIEKAVVVGHSMGAVVAPYVAAKYSDRIVTAVLIGPVLPSPEAGKTFEKRIEAVQKGAKAASYPACSNITHTDTHLDGMEAIASTIPTAATGSQSTPLHHAFIRTLLLSQRPAGYISMCRVIGSATPPDYGKIRVPVLIIAGEEDKSAPLQGCEEILKRIGSEEKKMVVSKGVGHWICIENPGKVKDAIGDFYRQIQ